ncbi:MAG: CDP-diacylglycerol--glycerol-3-phosphate 3-phosphatidyltransferase [Alphaproteobacteria bacterium]
MNLPNTLTILRIFAVPAIVVLLLIDRDTARWAAFILFVLAAATDYLDGYLARTMSTQTALGRLLDPIADKILVGAVILMLAGVGTVSGLALIPAVLILCREFVVAGLREYMAEQGTTLHVIPLAKWKTMVQMVALAILIVGNAGPPAIPLHEIGIVALWLAALLTVITGYDYVVATTRQLAHNQEAHANGGKS